MDEKIKMETNLKGGLMKGIGRMFSGESLFMATYTSMAPAQEIVFASTFPGQILEFDLLKGDVVGNDNIEYIRARNIKISSDSELESDVDGDKSDNLPVEIKVLAQRVEVFSKPKE